MLPDTAFDALDVPQIGNQPEDVDRRILFAARLVQLGVLACRRLDRPLKVTTLLPLVERIEALDALVIDFAAAVLSAKAWQRIAANLAGFGERSIPRAYQGRDKRIPALWLYLREEPCENPEAARLLDGFASACRYDGARYNAILANLAGEGVLESAAVQVLEHLEGGSDNGSTVNEKEGSA
ncbi:hypothetical protein DU505_18920 [Billgrantia montanilacus]|uniref:Uncharacterized protein n=2 Tax=Billgrantia montanilacus TaxID=2282305 RepID=A0A368TQH8_9GAMM|nr:hypothetical protein DU505_18920 [Halomonas montanilacus]